MADNLPSAAQKAMSHDWEAWGRGRERKPLESFLPAAEVLVGGLSIYKLHINCERRKRILNSAVFGAPYH